MSLRAARAAASGLGDASGAAGAVGQEVVGTLGQILEAAELDQRGGLVLILGACIWRHRCPPGGSASQFAIASSFARFPPLVEPGRSERDSCGKQRLWLRPRCAQPLRI